MISSVAHSLLLSLSLSLSLALFLSFSVATPVFGKKLNGFPRRYRSIVDATDGIIECVFFVRCFLLQDERICVTFFMRFSFLPDRKRQPPRFFFSYPTVSLDYAYRRLPVVSVQRGGKFNYCKRLGAVTVRFHWGWS